MNSLRFVAQTLTDRRFRRTTLLTWGSFALLVGLRFGKYGLPIDLWIFLVAIVVLLVTWRKRTLLSLVVIVLGCMVVGQARGNSFSRDINNYEDLYGQKIVVYATALQDGTYDDRGQLVFEAGSLELKEPYSDFLLGKVKIGAFGVPAVARGDRVSAEAKLYPSGGSRQGSLSFAEVKVLSHDSSLVEKIRRRFVAGMYNALPEPQASFSLGLLLGQRSTLPKDVTLALSAVGLTHIIAVSGYNLTIIIRSVRRFSSKRSKYQSVLISVVLIAVFLLMTGFSASIVRASVVCALSLLAWFYGRTVKPMLLLGLSAAGTAMVNPLYVWNDIGWYLSFLAFFGVLVLAPAVTRRLFGPKKPKFIGQLVIESISAYVMTAPLILFIFQETSVIALLSNVLVVPLVPLAMLFVLVAGIGGMFLDVTAGIVGLPGQLITTYILDVANVLSRIPGALVNRQIGLVSMLSIYSAICLLIIVISRRATAKYGIVTEENYLD